MCVCVCALACLLFVLFTFIMLYVMFLVFACFAFVLFIVLMLTLALVQRYEDALASSCALKVLFPIIIIIITIWWAYLFSLQNLYVHFSK